MLQYAIDSNLFYLAEAETIFETVKKFEGNDNLVLARLLPRVALPIDAKSFVNTYVGKDALAMKHLKQAMGTSFQPMLGLFSGYYCLDLVKLCDRTCLGRLLQRNSAAVMHRQGKGLGDTSQSGNWTCFRNILRDGVGVSNLDPSVSDLNSH